MPSTDVIQLTLTLKMTTAEDVEMSVTVNNNSPIQDYVHPDDQTQPTFEIGLLLFANSSLDLQCNSFWLLPSCIVLFILCFGYLQQKYLLF